MSKFTRTTTSTAARKTVRAKDVTPTIEVELPEPKADDEVLSAWAQVQAAIDNMLGKLQRPSWVRTIVNYAVGMVAYASTFYGCMALIEPLMAGVMFYTGPGFLAFLISFFAIFAAFMASFKVGKIAYEFAASFDYGSVKGRVTGWFTRSPKPVTA